MVSWVLLTVAAATAVWSPDLSRCPENGEVDRACARIVNSEVCARQVELCRLKEGSPWVVRDGATLRLELAGGRSLSLTDGVPLSTLLELPGPRGEGDVVSWEFREYNPAADAFVVHAQYREAIGWVVIRRKDGAAFGFRDKPWFSPSGETLLTAGGWGSWGSRTATWWKDLETTPRAVAKLDVGGGEPTTVESWTTLLAPIAWRDEETIDVIVLENAQREGRQEIRRVPGQLLHTSDGWRLRPPVSAR